MEMMVMYSAAVNICRHKNDIGKKNELEVNYINRFLQGDYACNPFLRISPKYYNEFVTTVRLRTRLEFFHFSTGYTYRELADLLGYHSHASVQNILSKDLINTPKLLAQLAILYRVPPNWLTNESCSEEWVVYHFFDLKINKISKKEFEDLLEQTIFGESWIRFYIINTTIPDIFTFLRVECQKGNFLIEFFNKTGSVEDVLDLSYSLRSKYNCVEGLIITPVHGRKNRAIVCVRKGGFFCLPLEFRPYN
ncbi:transcriptional regulator with XRE-family HTH domain [Paenibacillus wynnii]|nr:transcriptional regulator with XRE-family HTH domain [Paenibacillus wynnii]